MAFELDPDYIDVAARIREFRTRYPEGTLGALDDAKPFEMVAGTHHTFVVVAAVARRTPDDPAPGVGLAWEPVPGTTPYTRNSELQNAQTAAWGRAIIAVGAADAKVVASAEEVRNRQAEQPEGQRPRQSRPNPQPQPQAQAQPGTGGVEMATDKQRKAIYAICMSRGLEDRTERNDVLSAYAGRTITDDRTITFDEAKIIITKLNEVEPDYSGPHDDSPVEAGYGFGTEPF